MSPSGKGPGSKKAPSPGRKERLAEQLRANLKKRRALARARGKAHRQPNDSADPDRTRVD
jgi:hypothetical protein